MSSPASTHGKPVEHRRENKIVLEIGIRPRSIGMELPWDCIQIPRTKSVQRPAVLGNKNALNFKLEVHGATTGRIRDSLCERCTEKESRNSSVVPTLVDFAAKTSIIDLTSGKAQVTFRFLCLSTHHGLADSEYRITAIISNGDQIVARQTLETRLRVTSRGAKTKNVNTARTSSSLDSARSSEDLIMQGPAETVLERDHTGNSVPSTSVLAPTISAFDRPPNTSGVLPDARQISNPTVIQPAVPHFASSTTTTDGEDCIISLLSPSCGSTSGGEQIVLLIINLPPSVTFFARFGDNIVSTSYHPPGVLICNLPPAAQPGTVEVTLSRTPSLDAPTYATSLVKFTYESDANRAATHILKIRDEGLRSEAMPFIQRVFQSHGNRGTASYAPQASSNHSTSVG